MQITDLDYDRPGDASNGIIRTVSGRYINVLNPQVEDIDIEDVARGLTNICRYGGQLNSIYTVAEHCLGVASQILRCTGDRRLARAGLWHDGPEAYIGDQVRPIKGLMSDYKVIEKRFEAVMWKALDLEDVDWTFVREVDLAIVPWEMALVRDARWRVPSPPETVYTNFLVLDHELRNGLV